MSMCSDRYAEETPLGFWKYQLPPTSSDASKQVCGRPKSESALQAVSPLTPAPMMQTEGSSPMRSALDLDALPEGEMAFDLPCCGQRRSVPCRPQDTLLPLDALRH